MLKFLTIILLCGPFIAEISTSNDVPEIILAQQIAEQSLQLAWSFNNESSRSDFSRYRILYKKETSKNLIFEWPAQIRRVENLSDFDYERSISTSSSFECFNECIKQIDCIAVFRVYSKPNTVNCFLKTQNNTLNASGFLIDDIEYIEIDEYSDNIVINNIPHNEVYRFQVSVFDSNVQKWSDFSNFSEIVNTTVDLGFNFERTGFNTGRINFQQMGDFTNYTISKLLVSIIVDNSFGLYIDTSAYKYSLEPSYFNKNPYSIVQSVEECEKLCQESDSSSFFAYFEQSDNITDIPANACMVYSYGLDLDNAVNKYKYSSVYALRKNTTEIELHDLMTNQIYEFRLSGYTPYGSQIASPVIVFVNISDYILVNLTATKNLKNLSISLNWNVEPNNLTLSRFQVLIKNNFEVNYYAEESTDYEDSNEQSLFAEYLVSCFKFCYDNRDCVAYTWNSDSGICSIKHTLDNPIDCDFDNNDECYKIPRYTNDLTIKDILINNEYCFEVSIQTIEGYMSETSNRDCVTFQVGVKVENLTSFNEGGQGIIKCSLNSIIDNSLIRNITWLKDNSTETLNELSKEIEFTEDRLIFKNLSRNIFDGLYECIMDISEGQFLRSSNRVEVLVQFPSNVKINSNSKVLRFNKTDSVNISCTVNGVPKKELIWLFSKENTSVEISDVVYINSSTSSSTLILELQNIDKNHDGNYTCSIKDTPWLNDEIQIIVQTVPSKPTILNASVATNETRIVWSVEDNGKSGLIYVLLEWCDDFTDSLSLPYSKYFLFTQNVKNEIIVDFKLKNNTQLRISASNIVGQSEKSIEYILKYDEEIIDANNDTYLVPFILTLIFFLISTAIIIFNLLYKRYRKSKDSELLMANMDEIRLN